MTSFDVLAFMSGTAVRLGLFAVDDFSPVGKTVRGAVFHACVPFAGWILIVDISSLAGFVFL